MKIHIFSIESIETRYTKQWHTHIPKLLQENGFEVNQIDGEISTSKPTPGAFLNFTATNLWKSTQLAKFIAQVEAGEIGDNDHILFTDAWNPCITQLKYINDLSNKNWVFHGIWHAGSYDPQDFLGRIENKDWIRNLERSMFQSYDHNYFATDFHINLFTKNLLNIEHAKIYYPEPNKCVHGIQFVNEYVRSKKIVRTGFPFEYLENIVRKGYCPGNKTDTIIFPHRISSEKQIDIFLDLKEELPQYDWIVCQETPKTKQEYHKILQSSKICFSGNLQETLGISQVEALFVDSFPMCPERLSYKEMFNHTFLYPSKWTENWDSYVANKESLKAKIIDIMNNYQQYDSIIQEQKQNLNQKFFSATEMIKILKEYNDKTNTNQ
jgi:glycosyltransferase involved in cell wall biosynthesis